MVKKLISRCPLCNKKLHETKYQCSDKYAWCTSVERYVKRIQWECSCGWKGHPDLTLKETIDILD